MKRAAVAALAPTGDPHTDPELDRAALISIDTQCDTLDGGALEIAGTSQALPAMRALCEAFRASARPIVHVVRLYEPDGSNVDPCRRAAVAGGTPMLLTGAPGSALADELLPQRGVSLDCPLLLGGGLQRLGPHEMALYKPRWGAFYRTPLEQHLRALDVSTLVFCGCNFPNCPRTSIYEASERDFRVVLARDAISGLYERGEAELLAIGVHVVDAAELIDAMAPAPRASM